MTAKDRLRLNFVRLFVRHQPGTRTAAFQPQPAKKTRKHPHTCSPSVADHCAASTPLLPFAAHRHGVKLCRTYAAANGNPPHAPDCQFLKCPPLLGEH